MADLKSLPNASPEEVAAAQNKMKSRNDFVQAFGGAPTKFSGVTEWAPPAAGGKPLSPFQQARVKAMEELEGGKLTSDEIRRISAQDMNQAGPENETSQEGSGEDQTVMLQKAIERGLLDKNSDAQKKALQRRRQKASPEVYSATE
jgi:hypothetical protein